MERRWRHCGNKLSHNAIKREEGRELRNFFNEHKNKINVIRKWGKPVCYTFSFLLICINARLVLTRNFCPEIGGMRIDPCHDPNLPWYHDEKSFSSHHRNIIKKLIGRWLIVPIFGTVIFFFKKKYQKKKKTPLEASKPWFRYPGDRIFMIIYLIFIFGIFASRTEFSCSNCVNTTIIQLLSMSKYREFRPLSTTPSSSLTVS